MWDRAWAGLCCSTPVALGQSLPVPWRPRVCLCPSLVSLENLPDGAFGNSLEMASFVGRGLGAARPRVSLLPAVGKVLVQTWVMHPATGACLAQTPPVLDHVPPALLQSCLSPGRSHAGVSKGSRCLVLLMGASSKPRPGWTTGWNPQ